MRKASCPARALRAALPLAFSGPRAPSRLKRFVASCAFLCAAGAAGAQNLLVNPGFEIPPTPSGALVTFAGGSDIGGWTVLGPSTAVSLVNTTYAEPQNGMTAFQAHGGLNSLDLTGPGNNGTASGVQQAVATVAGTEHLVAGLGLLGFVARRSL